MTYKEEAPPPEIVEQSIESETILEQPKEDVVAEVITQSTPEQPADLLVWIFVI